MYRTCYKLLLYFMVLTFALASSTLAGMEGGERVISAYFDPPLNEVTAPPPNYNLIDSSIFEGVPPFAEMSDYELGGYYLYWDKTNGRWTLCSVVVPGGQLFEQLHGSILVQMEQEPVPGVNVWPLGFVVSDDLAKNDRWGWVKWPESIAPNLYEIWWDYTVDYTRLEKNSDYQDTIGICFTGCAFDFNIWASGHFKAFQPNQLKLGAKTTPISELAGFSDSYDGVDDKYQGETSVQEANTSLFTQKDLPGKTYNANGQIFPGTPYGDAYGKNIAYEGNGIQFSVATCAVETSPDFDPPLGQATPLTICLGETIYDTITAVDPDEFDTVTISIISGPGTLTGEPGNPATAYYEFTPNTPGNYTVVYEAVDLSGLNYVDSVTYQVSFNQPPKASASDSLVKFCWDMEAICYTVSASDDGDDPLTFTLLNGPGNINPVTGELCFTPTDPGAYDFSVEVSDGCGADTVLFSITVLQNNDPAVIPFDTLIQICGPPDSICFDITAFDPDLGDSLVISLISGPGLFELTGNGTGRQCFLPENADSTRYVFQYSVTDECWREIWGGKLATPPAPPQDSIVIIVVGGTSPEITCPDPIDVNLCAPDSVCYDIGIIPADANVVVTGDAVYANGKLCFYAEQTGIYGFTITATNDCGEVICNPIFNVTVNQAPVIKEIGDIDIIYCDMTELCLDLNLSDPDSNIYLVQLYGDCDGLVYDDANDQICIALAGGIDCQLNVMVTDSCGLADTMSVKIRAVPNSPPTIQLPSLETVVRCVTDSVPIVIDGFCVFDPEYDELVVTLDSGSGEFSFNDVTNCGSLTFTPPDNDSGQYCFRFMVADVCDTIYAEYCMNVVPASVCSSCVSIEIVTPPCTNTGGLATVNIFAEAVNEMAGYDLLLAYDGTALTFTRAIMGEALPHWEFFTYRFGPNGNCSGDCPTGMLRLVAIADVNNGAHHPPQDEYLPSGPIASITFRVSSDLNLGGQYIPIEFFWFDCGDNSASDPSGQFLYIEQVVLGPEGNIIWDEANNDAYPESNRYDFIGAPDECLIGEKELPVRCIDFQNGALCITHPDSVDARGDLNLNGVAYEIADAVVYTNFFISGISAFTISVPGQIAASDINADGKTLSIADLVYLVRIITGDAPPFPKLSVDNSEVLISTKAEGKITTVSIDASQDIGAALLVFNAIGTTGGTVRLVGSHNMDMMYGWVDGTLRVLIYSFDAVGKIEAGQSALLEVVSPDGGGVVLVEAEMADYYANEISVKIASTTLPSLLELTQNHPNPFNPTTTFMMYLPFASDYTVTIFNVTGQRIKEWSGYGHAGYIEFTWDGKDENGVRAASGIYLYRAHAAGSEAIRKMVLLK